jgi:hypothetical protein
VDRYCIVLVDFVPSVVALSRSHICPNGPNKGKIQVESKLSANLLALLVHWQEKLLENEKWGTIADFEENTPSRKIGMKLVGWIRK